MLFNAGALYTQLAAKQDRLSARGLDQAIDAFLRAAGTFRYIHENFTNAPSMDLGPDMLEMLVQLMLVTICTDRYLRRQPIVAAILTRHPLSRLQAQARECLFEKLELQSKDGRNVDVSVDLAQEASQVALVVGHLASTLYVNSIEKSSLFTEQMVGGFLGCGCLQ